MASRGPGRPAWAWLRSARTAKNLIVLAAAGAVAACSMPAGPSGSESRFAAATGGATTAAAKPATYKLGGSYRIAGRWYHPREEPGYDEVGLASWYGDDFHGRQTANGETYDMNGLTAAHPTLPMPSYARVTNLDNGRSVVVRINDRGPFAHGRVIDLSKQTARVLDFKRNGTARVRVQYVGIASAHGEDGWLTTTVRQNGEPVGPTMVAQPPDGGVSMQQVSVVPSAVMGDQPTLASVSGYTATPSANLVADTFRLFDEHPTFRTPGTALPAAASVSDLY